MKNNFTEHEIVLFLLQQLSEEKAAELRGFLDSDKDFYDTVVFIESALIDRYLFDQLNPVERSQFEEYYMTTERGKQTLELDRAINTVIGLSEKHADGPARLILNSI